MSGKCVGPPHAFITQPWGFAGHIPIKTALLKAVFPPPIPPPSASTFTIPLFLSCIFFPLLYNKEMDTSNYHIANR